MNALPPKPLAVDQTRKLLIKAGLREDEADRFLSRLTDELSAGAMKHEGERLTFIERELARLEVSRHRAPTSSGDMRTALIGIASGVAANFLTDAIKSEISDGRVEVLPPLSQPAPQKIQHPATIIQIEWAGARLPAQMEVAKLGVGSGYV
jgi:hypothetical protein